MFERLITNGRVSRPTVEVERLKTTGSVAGTDSVIKERARAAGRIIITHCVRGQCALTKGAIKDAARVGKERKGSMGGIVAAPAMAKSRGAAVALVLVSGIGEGRPGPGPGVKLPVIS